MPFLLAIAEETGFAKNENLIASPSELDLRRERASKVRKYSLNPIPHHQAGQAFAVTAESSSVSGRSRGRKRRTVPCRWPARVAWGASAMPQADFSCAGVSRRLASLRKASTWRSKGSGPGFSPLMTLWMYRAVVGAS